MRCCPPRKNSCKQIPLPAACRASPPMHSPQLLSRSAAHPASPSTQLTTCTRSPGWWQRRRARPRRRPSPQPHQRRCRWHPVAGDPAPEANEAHCALLACQLIAAVACSSVMPAHAQRGQPGPPAAELPDTAPPSTHLVHSEGGVDARTVHLLALHTESTPGGRQVSRQQLGRATRRHRTPRRFSSGYNPRPKPPCAEHGCPQPAAPAHRGGARRGPCPWGPPAPR